MTAAPIIRKKVLRTHPALQHRALGVGIRIVVCQPEITILEDCKCIRGLSWQLDAALATLSLARRRGVKPARFAVADAIVWQYDRINGYSVLLSGPPKPTQFKPTWVSTSKRQHHTQDGLN
jgi:hypothetical protein